MRKLLMTLGVIAMTVGAAAPAHAGESAVWGTGIGAALGGLLGSQFGKGDGRLATTGLGVFMGGVVGNQMGQSMDRANAGYAGRGYSGYGYYAPGPSYYAESYSYYQPTYVAPPAPPVRAVYVQEEDDYRTRAPVYVQQSYVGSRSTSYCREYTQQVRIGDRIEESYGTACLQPDGSWQVRQ